MKGLLLSASVYVCTERHFSYLAICSQNDADGAIIVCRETDDRSIIV